MTCESLDKPAFLRRAAEIVVELEQVTNRKDELVGQIGSKELARVMNRQRELEPLQSHVLSETRRRGLHDDLVKVLEEARKRK